MGQRLPRANTGFNTLIDADLVTQGQAIVDGLTASAADFPNPPISPADLQGFLNGYSSALAASIGGSLVQRAEMRARRNTLRTVIRQDAFYVNQMAALFASQGLAYTQISELIAGTGFQLGKQPAPAGPLPPPTVIKFSSPKVGVLYVLLGAIKNAKAYVIVFGKTGTPETGWETVAFPNTRINLLNLDSGSEYTFRLYAQGASTAINFTADLTQVII